MLKMMDTVIEDARKLVDTGHLIFEGNVSPDEMRDAFIMLPWLLAKIDQQARQINELEHMDE